MKREPQNALAWARLAELHASFGELGKALDAAQKAVALEPNLARTQTVLGYAYLMQVKTRQAREAFEKAIVAGPGRSAAPARSWARPDPRRRSRRGQPRHRGRGRASIRATPSSAAISARPTTRRSAAPLDEREYSVAKELDPNDPTPWFYSAIAKQTTNRPVEALRDLQKAIELNDNRAVYRSRLLLDADEAAARRQHRPHLLGSGLPAARPRGGLEVGQHRSDQFLRPPLPGRLVRGAAAPRDRAGQRAAAVRSCCSRSTARRSSRDSPRATCS